MTETIFCSECGQGCPSSAKYCHACGSQLLAVSPGAQTAQAGWIAEIYRCLTANEAAEAERLARGQLSLDQSDATAHALLGTSLFAQYRVEEAAEAFQRAIALSSDTFLVRWEYALFLGKMARYGDAAVEVKAAMSIAPTRTDFRRAQDLLRLMTQKSQGSFLHQSFLPSFRWPSRRAKP